jgi:hypothetical protein
MILSAEAPAVGDVFCICCRMLGSLILSAEVLTFGVFCLCCGTLGSLIFLAEVPAVGVCCIRCRTQGSLILSAGAPGVGVFCFLVRSFIHVRFGSLTYLSTLTISGRLITGICFFDIFLIFG